MWLRIVGAAVFSAAILTAPVESAEAQQRQSCKWNDKECLERASEQGKREEQRAAEQRRTRERQAQVEESRRECRWNDAECIRREREAERARNDRDGRYDRDDDDYDDDDRPYRGNRGKAKGKDKIKQKDVRCVDWDREGRCFRWERVGYERDRRNDDRHNFPHMSSALAMRNGRGVPADARPFVGRGPFGVALQNRDRDALPERAVIESRSTNRRTVWEDRNNDGWADLIQIYENGRLIRTIG